MDSRCQFIHDDFLTHPFTEKFDAVIALGVFDYTNRPAALLRKMADLASRRVVASFPGVSLLRAPLRKIRYALRGCPVYFYTASKLHRICQESGLEKYRIVRCASSGFVLLGELD